MTEKMRKQRDLAKQRNFDYIREYKEYHRCCECSEGRAVCLDLHHEDPNTKKFTLSDGKSHSIKSINLELKKCIVLCANCHRLHHAQVQHEKVIKEENETNTLF
ncbi:hypothetical protein LCGC14_0538750 [marine sediment metagenome]|uniref:Uncharacterized protein n=1 Tax=marine sediment metagenome TaxID=412755 RepID=A0A0F9RTM5_9ZZZZ